MGGQALSLLFFLRITLFLNIVSSMPLEDTILLLRVTLLLFPNKRLRSRFYLYLYRASYIWVSRLDPQVQLIFHLVLTGSRCWLGNEEGRGNGVKILARECLGVLVDDDSLQHQEDGCMYERWI